MRFSFHPPYPVSYTHLDVYNRQIRNRITELRLKKGVSEYQISMELGQNRSYIQAISSGRSMPSMKHFLNSCEYFEITPLQFFDAQENNPQLSKKALDGMRKMSDDDLIMLIGFITVSYTHLDVYKRQGLDHLGDTPGP